MFLTKSRIEKIKEEINKDNVECEKCGCLVRKDHAFRGKSKIVEVFAYSPFSSYPRTKEVIKETYYCKLHSPKK